MWRHRSSAVAGSTGAISLASPSQIRNIAVCVERRSRERGLSVYMRSFVTST